MIPEGHLVFTKYLEFSGNNEVQHVKLVPLLASLHVVFEMFYICLDLLLSIF